MTDSILPPNSSKFERDIEELGGKKRIDAVENPVGSLWNPQSVPAKILPYLAWALSVDKWEDDWSDEIKRNVIAASVEVHRKKGTVGAVKKAIAATGIDVEFFEWFENNATPHTFSVTAWSNDNINEDGTTRLLPKTHADTISGINATKPVRAHFELMFGSRIPTDVGMALDGNATGRVNDSNEIVPYPNRSNTLAGTKYDTHAPGRTNQTQEIIPYTNRSNSSAGGKYDPLVTTRISGSNEIVPYPNRSSSSAGGKYDPLVAARASDSVEVIAYTSKAETSAGGKYDPHVASRAIHEQEVIPYPNKSNSEVGGGYESLVTARVGESQEIIPYTNRSNSTVGTQYDPFVTARTSESVEMTPYVNSTGSDFGMSGLFAENSRVNLNLEII